MNKTKTVFITRKQYDSILENPDYIYDKDSKIFSKVDLKWSLGGVKITGSNENVNKIVEWIK